MAGVVSPSMWVFVLRDEAHDRTSWCSLNEGLGKVLRYGAYGPDVIDRLRWMSAVLGPALQAAVRGAGPIDIKAIVGQMVQMGDEGHNRNRAGTLMLLRDLLPHLVDAGLPSGDVADVARFVGGNDHFFLNLVMPAAKLQAAPAADIPGATVVTAMARNGTDFGIQVSGTGDAWFTGPASVPSGCSSARTGPMTPTPTSATRRSPRPPGWAGSRWPAPRRSSGSSAARSRTRCAPPPRCTRSPSRRTRRTRCRSSTSGARRPGSTWSPWSAPACFRRSTPASRAGCRAPGRSGPAW